MGLSQEEHADAGLADAAADGVWHFPLNHCLMEREIRPLHASGRFQLAKQRLLIHPDAHAGQLQSNVQDGVVDNDIRVQLPVVIVRGPPVMRFAVPQRAADLHHAYGALGLGYVIFPLPGRIVREHFLQLAGGDEEDVVGKNFFNIVIVDGHVLLCFAQHLIYSAHRIL